MDNVDQTKQNIIKKHRKPIVKLDYYEQRRKKIFGKMKGTIHIKGDIIKPIGEDWYA